MSDSEEGPHHTTINIHAPVFGHVAGRDVNCAEPLAEPERPSLCELEAQLRQAQAESWRARLGFYVNAPCLLLLGWTTLGAGLFVLGLTRRPLFSGEALPMPVPALAVWALGVLGSATWLDLVRRRMRHVIADWEAEVQYLERAVALSRAGRW
ncbi:hypothetical protein HNQ51_001742 [Inhella inkyongensis]|uniref:Uncharacterized protein n=1 Tax=Inhella inkyongensis TaxID=392593 RepID=A0A840S4P0_9BURK|nr:hypothetical protein [Inhella inkyongensis]MBB5204428.1 hypothetical protein [Inhella inkyongensis]